MVRVFIAVEPSAEIRKNIAEAGTALTGAGRLSLVSADLMHITLKFLGEIPESSLAKIQTALAGIGSVQPGYTLTASKVSTFGRPVRVIKTEVHDCGASANLAAEIDKRLSRLGFSREDKPFSPHITMARVKEPSPLLGQKTAELKDCEFGSCDIHELLIKKSVLTPKGPIYSTIYRIEL
ncbi:MAG TPA: RNA 2',3'-cyclic phosphodiesterase [Methanocorpusculum sp.]|nr:RNA 2',3'-cyclic phosphodiesterase [Methanocorpusculum sp.]